MRSNPRSAAPPFWHVTCSRTRHEARRADVTPCFGHAVVAVVCPALRDPFGRVQFGRLWHWQIGHRYRHRPEQLGRFDRAVRWRRRQRANRRGERGGRGHRGRLVPRESGRCDVSVPSVGGGYSRAAAQRSTSSRSRLLGRLRDDELLVPDVVHHVLLRRCRWWRGVGVHEQQRLPAGDGRSANALLRPQLGPSRCRHRRRWAGRAMHAAVPQVYGAVSRVAWLAMLPRLRCRWPHRDLLHAERRRSLRWQLPSSVRHATSFDAVLVRRLHIGRP